MKCDGLPDPVCVRELNTYLSLWKEDDTREDIDQVFQIIWNTIFSKYCYILCQNCSSYIITSIKLFRYWREQWRFCQ